MSQYTKEKTKAGAVAAFIFSMIFSIILMACLAGLNGFLLVKITCQDLIGNGNDGILQYVDIKKIPIGEFVSSMELDGVEINEQTVFSDIVYGVLDNVGIPVSSKEQVEKMLDSMEVEFLLGDIKSEYLKVFLGEQKTACIKNEHLLELVEKNRKVIETSLATEVTDVHIEGVRFFLEQNRIEEQTVLELPEEYLKIIDIVRLFLDDTNRLTWILGAGIAVVFVLLALCNLKRIHGVLVYAGIGFFLPGACGIWLSGRLNTLLEQFVKIKSTIIDSLVAAITEIINKNAYVFLCIGGGMFLLFLTASVIARARKKK